MSLVRWLIRQRTSIIAGFVGIATAGIATLFALTALRQIGPSWPDFDTGKWLELFGLLVVRATAGTIGSLAFGHLAAHALTDYRRRLFGNLLHAPLGFHDQNWTADLVASLVSDAAFIQDILARVLPAIALNAPTAVIASILLLRLSAPLLISIVLIALPLALILGLAGKHLRGLTQRSQTVLGRISISAQESFSGVRLIKAMAREALFVQQIDRLTQQHLHIKQHIMFWQALISNAAPLAALCISLGGAILARQQLIADGITRAELSLFVIYLFVLATSCLALMNVYTSVEPAVGALLRMMKLENGATSAETEDGATLTTCSGALSLRNVTFEYATRKAGIYNISLEVAPGESIALIGANGAGKSTLIQLLLRMYEPHEGKILLDNRQAASVSLKSWRRQFAVVSRDPMIFSLSIAENIALGNPDASTVEISQAAGMVGLDTYIRSLPDGYQSTVGESGVQLSAGQRQRLALARVFLQNPAIILFDEATTSLDRDSEVALLDALRDWQGQRTLIFVAHQTSGLWPISRTIMLENGRLIDPSADAKARSSL